MKQAREPFTITNGKVTYDHPQLYQCECPAGHGKFGYKTRLPIEDVVVRCVHCSTRVTVQFTKTQGGARGLVS